MLSKQSSVPLYRQVKTELLNDIQTNVYKVGEPIPTEKQLELNYNTSRITIRKAVDQLVDEKVLIKKQGKGTFVRTRKIQRNLLDLISYTTYMEDSGKKPEAAIQTLTTQNAELDLANKLQVVEGSPIIKLARVMELDEHNFGYETSFYDSKRYPNLIDQISDNRSVTKVLYERFQVREGSSNQTLNVIFANKQMAEYLRIDNGVPIYKLERVVYDQGNNIMYYAVMYYDVNKVSFSIKTKEN
ncbi:GntR family transcriptional regulator [Paucilactobacillus kaifaensis]|uniref:GntR family transcriptional regulator n=1 Tax=Paucilactobacillus kaifaensis TaxID=2559921 RepID=UPI0010FA3997|nr:UTRA domain-containing protein [Paucilactobacillus kaifaensis]